MEFVSCGQMLTPSAIMKRLRKLGFQGPYTGTRHQFMVWKQHRMAIPSNDEYSIPQLKMMLCEVTNIIGEEISIGEWAEL